jgi:hypothetical protein
MVNPGLFDLLAEGTFSQTHFLGNVTHGFVRLIDDADGLGFLLVCE